MVCPIDPNDEGRIVQIDIPWRRGRRVVPLLLRVLTTKVLRRYEESQTLQPHRVDRRISKRRTSEMLSTLRMICDAQFTVTGKKLPPTLSRGSFLPHINVLVVSGLLKEDDNGAISITLAGMEKIDEWEHPIRYWLTKNWFPAIVALATVLVSLTSIILEILP